MCLQYSTVREWWSRHGHELQQWNIIMIICNNWNKKIKWWEGRKEWEWERKKRYKNTEIERRLINSHNVASWYPWAAWETEQRVMPQQTLLSFPFMLTHSTIHLPPNTQRGKERESLKQDLPFPDRERQKFITFSPRQTYVVIYS